MNTPGTLIVIDGADGAGKATQTALLVERLGDKGLEVETLDFPQYKENFFGAFLKECLMGEHGDFVKLSPKIASALYAADRYESSNTIREWLESGKIVILDRYVSSNMLHQGSKIEEEIELTEFLEWLDKLEHEVYKVPRPHMIVYLDVPYEKRRKMMSEDQSRRADTYDKDGDFQIASEKCARKIISQTNNWKTVDCTDGDDLRAPKDIHEDILVHVLEEIEE